MIGFCRSCNKQVSVSGSTVMEGTSCPQCGGLLSAQGDADPAALIQTRVVAPAPAGVGSTAPPSGSSGDTEVSKTRANDDNAEGTATICTEAKAAGADGGAIVPGYEVIGLLGRGGMGVVYKARQLALRRVVALKMVLAGSHASPSQLERFHIEAEAVARLRHPGIVQIYEIGAHRGLPYFSLEFCNAGSLGSIVGGDPLPPVPAAEIVQKLAEAMQTAHDQQIIHRDLKPANILLHLADEQLLQQGAPAATILRHAVAKITDFGLAKKLDDEGQTQTGAVLGTATYMAPEQARGDTQAVGPRADIYALGAILYKLLTGGPPFRGPSVAELLLQVVNDEPLRPTQLQPRTPRDLETIALKCLDKDPARRYASCRALAADLGRWLRHEPIEARPASTLERALKWGRRHPARAGLLLSSALLCAVCLTGIVGWQRHEIERLQREQKEQAELQQREEANQTLLAGVRRELNQAELLEQQWDLAGAARELSAAQAALRGKQELHALPIKKQLDQHWQQVQAKLAMAEKRAQFQNAYHQSMFHLTRLTGLDAEGNRVKARAHARHALGLFDMAGTTIVDPALRQAQSLLPSEVHKELLGDCFQMLVVWAETEADATADAGSLPQRSECGLALLERAAQVAAACSLESRVVALLRDEYRAQQAGRPADRDGPRWRNLEPVAALDWYLLGLAHYNANRFHDAEKACAEVLRKQPRHFAARYLHSIALLRGGHHVEAKAGLTICLESRPDFSWPLVLRGFASCELGKKHQKETEFESARADFDQVLGREADPLLRFNALVNRGVLAIYRQQWSAAVADLEAAAALQPGAFQPHLNLAVVHKETGKTNAALAALSAAIERAPALTSLYSERGDLHLRLRALAAARADYEKLVDLGQRDPRLHSDGGAAEAARLSLASAHVKLGTLRFDDEHPRDALGHADAALRLQGDYSLAHLLRAKALLALERSEEAAASLDRYLALSPRPDIEAYRARGLLHAGAAQLPAAVEVYTIGLDRHPADAQLRALRGWAYLVLGAAAAALADFDHCLRQGERDADALCGRGRARVALKQFEQAFRDAEAARGQGPPTDRLQYNLACLYAQLAASSETDPVQQQYAPLYRRRAGQRLIELLSAMTPTKRESFWRTFVRNDPALAGLRSSPVFAELARLYHLPEQ